MKHKSSVLIQKEICCQQGIINNLTINPAASGYFGQTVPVISVQSLQARHLSSRMNWR